MEGNQRESEQSEDNEEYIFLDLASVSSIVDLAAGASYTLSRLDTLNPVLIIGDGLKLIGEYQETMGTCLVFAESDCEPVVHPETGPSERNLFRETCIIDNDRKTPTKDVLPIANSLKILRFRLAKENEV